MLPYYQVATKLVMAGLVSNIYFIMQQGVCCSDRWECFIFSGFHVCLFTFFIYIHINFFFEFRFLSSRWTYQLYFSLSWTAHKLATLVWSYYSWISPPPPSIHDSVDSAPVDLFRVVIVVGNSNDGDCQSHSHSTRFTEFPSRNWMRFRLLGP